MCDLLDVQGRRFIQVKKNSRKSSILSHFFKQGSNSDQMLIKYPRFREIFVSKIRELYGKDNADIFDNNISENWTVEFQIADIPRRNVEYDIPFFSKLTLRDEARNLEALRYKVAIKFIRLATIPPSG